MRVRQPSRKQASHRGIYPRAALACLAAIAALSLAAFANGRRTDSPAKARSDQTVPPTSMQATPGTPIDAQFKGKLPISELSEEEAAAHALNRLGYGPRPGDIEQIKQMGLEKWIDLQLHPERLDDSRLQARLQQFPTLGLSAGALLTEYPRPEDGAKREGISVEEYRKRMDALAHPPQGIRPAPSTEPQEVLNEAQQAKVLRTLYSERQLEQQLTDFWFNHFNVYAYKDLDQWFLEPYERDAIRPHVLGKFRDLLEATAKSPAMLFYLDNYLSADPQSFDRLQALATGETPASGRKAAAARRQARPERKLRARTDGAAHAGRGRRLHATRRRRSGAQLHRLDHPRSAHQSRILFRRHAFTIPIRSACWARRSMPAESRTASRCSTCW